MLKKIPSVLIEVSEKRSPQIYFERQVLKDRRPVAVVWLVWGWVTGSGFISALREKAWHQTSCHLGKVWLGDCAQVPIPKEFSMWHPCDTVLTARTLTLLLVGVMEPSPSKTQKIWGLSQVYQVHCETPYRAGSIQQNLGEEHLFPHGGAAWEWSCTVVSIITGEKPIPWDQSEIRVLHLLKILICFKKAILSEII